MVFKRIVTIFVLVNIVYLTAACGRQPVVKSRPARKKIALGESFPAPYEIAKVDDASHKATTKPISVYSVEQLAALPMAKKVTCKVLVPGDIRRSQVKPTIVKIISQLTAQDPDIDEIDLFLFINHKDRDSSDSTTEFATTFSDTNTYTETINSKFDVASASWHPGDMTRGKVTPELAVSNSRDGYETDIKIRENLEEYLQQKEMFKESFNLTEAEKKTIYIDIMAARGKTAEEARKMFPDDPQKAALKEADLEKQSNADLRAKHIITDEMIKQITEEGKAAGWPTK